MWLFRFDARLYFTDKAQFIHKPTEVAPSLTPEEEEMERHCDEERYIDLHQDSAEYDIQQGKIQQTKLLIMLIQKYPYLVQGPSIALGE